MRPRTPALLLCSLLVALAGCDSGDADAASSSQSGSTASQGSATKGPPQWVLSQDTCTARRKPGRNAPTGATSTKKIVLRAGRAAVHPASPLVVEQGGSMAFTSEHAFAVAIPSSVDLDDPNQHSVSGAAYDTVDVGVPDKALCGDFKYAVALYDGGAVRVSDPNGEIWPSGSLNP